MTMRFILGSLFLLSSSMALAQITSSPADTAIPLSGVNNPDVMLTGKVAADSQSSLPDHATVLLECNDQVRARTTTDSKGGYTLAISVLQDGFENASPRARAGVISSSEWATCGLYGDAPGFRSERVRVISESPHGIVNVAPILLHPIEPLQPGVDGATVDIASLTAPDKAKKAFNKGREQERKGKWAAACEYFKKAVSDYPRFAMAWLELGRAQIKQNSFADAQESLQQAVSQNPRSMDGYLELARLAAQQRNWKELADLTGRIVDSSPDYSPEFWLMNSAANYNLGDLTRAETSVQRGLRLDASHKLPQLEYLCGLIMAGKGDYKRASEHLTEYLRLVPNAKDAPAARQTLEGLQKREQLAAR